MEYHENADIVLWSHFKPQVSHAFCPNPRHDATYVPQSPPIDASTRSTSVVDRQVLLARKSRHESSS